MTTLPAGATGLTRSRYDTSLVPAWVGAVAALVAASVHLYVAPEHLREWWLYGAFFLSVAAAQAALAVLLLRGSGLLVALGGIWGNVAVIGIYVASRTTGLPLAPPGGHHGHHGVVGGLGSVVPFIPGAPNPNIEAVGSLDLAALGAELIVVVALVTLLPTAVRRVTTNL